jgi:hypothetical protein
MAIEGNATPPMEQIGGVHWQRILSVVDRESDTPAAVISVHVKMNVTIEDHEENGTVSVWVLRNQLCSHHPLSLVIKFGLDHTRKKDFDKTNGDRGQRYATNGTNWWCTLGEDSVRS